MRKSKKAEYKYKIFGIAVIAIMAVIFSMYGDRISTNVDNNIKQDNIINDNELKQDNVINDNELKQDMSDLKIYFFDVGQADSALIVNEGKTMLIDAGNEANGNQIVRYLEKLNIDKIDYLIATHVHADHIGGMDKVINNIDIGNVYMPYSTHTTKQFEQLITSIENKNLSITQTNLGDTFDIGNAKCEIMCVDHSQPDELNLSSIVIRMVYGNQSYLFMGDAETDNEKLRTWEKTNVIKIGHNGSSTSTSQKFVNETKPDIAIISVGKDNDYNLPKDSVIQRLKNIGATIYRTDEDGTILLTSDGNTNNIEKINLDEVN